MSRIGLKTISIPGSVELTQADGNISVKGPKGTLNVPLPKGLTLKIEDDTASLIAKPDAGKKLRSKHGLVRSLLAGAIEGTTEGYSKQLEVNGVGFRAQITGRTLTLKLGYSHDSVYQLPEGIEAAVDQNNITISGADKQLVGQVAAEIRKLRTPEPYKGKGIKYDDEYIIRKAGKAAGAAAKE
jgi:large subunit ribosomal protein L6